LEVPEAMVNTAVATTPELIGFALSNVPLSPERTQWLEPRVLLQMRDLPAVVAADPAVSATPLKSVVE
jgi:hypothetical protein